MGDCMPKNSVMVLAALLAFAILSTSCATPTPTPEPTPTIEPTTPPEPTATPVPPPPLGTIDHPIVMGFVPSNSSPDVLTGGEALAKQISDLSGYPLVAKTAESYRSLVESMGTGEVQVGWLETFAYTLAREKGFAEIGLVTVRSGADQYGFQLIAHVDSAFSPSSDPATALAQLKDRKPCWVDMSDPSGYVMPLGFLRKFNVPIKTGNAAAYLGSHPSVVRAVYAKGICDFGGTFIDARTSPAIQKDLPDAMDKVMVIYTSEPFIPKDTVSFASDLPTEARAKIMKALLEITETQAGKATLKTVFQVDGLKAADDNLFDEFRVYLAASGLDLATLVK